MGGEGGEPLRLPRLRLVLVAVALALFCLYLDFFALNLAVPGLARDLRTSVTELLETSGHTSQPEATTPAAQPETTP